jgi:hypothetical protein
MHLLSHEGIKIEPRMETVPERHLTDEKIAYYIRYLSETAGDSFDTKTIEEIQTHLNDCDRCMERVHNRYEMAAKAENKNFSGDVEEERAKIFETAKKLKELSLSETEMSMIDSILESGDDLDDNAVHVRFKTFPLADRLYSRLGILKYSELFEYEKMCDWSRGDGKSPVEDNFMKVITSEEVKNTMEIELNETERSLSVRLINEEQDFAPRIAMLRIDDRYGKDNLRIADVLYDGMTNSFEFKFEDLERGNYFVFIEPNFQV